MLKQIVNEYPKLSDINFTVGKPMQAKVHGELREVGREFNVGDLTSFQNELIALTLIEDNQRAIVELITQGSCDIAYQLSETIRFRLNIFSRRATYSIIMRKLPGGVPSLENMQLPEVLTRVAAERTGIVFVTGATGSGKSTTLAAILNAINQTKPFHIITLEDPVEFLHPQLMATFNQRELGLDFDTFANGLRSALRQAPEVIVVSEMRDRETVEIGLNAAETGHLVLTTLHTTDAGQTINRLIGLFEQSEGHQIRDRLASSLRWIIGQRLLPLKSGGRVAAFEIMGMNLSVSEAIVKGETENKNFYKFIQDRRHEGWSTFDDHILELYKKEMITKETSLSFASKKTRVKQNIDSIDRKQGIEPNRKELELESERSKT